MPATVSAFSATSVSQQTPSGIIPEPAKRPTEADLKLLATTVQCLLLTEEPTYSNIAIYL